MVSGRYHCAYDSKLSSKATPTLYPDTVPTSRCQARLYILCPETSACYSGS